MFAEVGVIGKLTKTIFDIFGITFLSRRKKAEKYVKEVVKHTSTVILSENEKEVQLSHSVVKKLYDNASKDIGNTVSGTNFEKIKQALAAARIYYWASQFSGKPGREIIDLIEARRYRIESGSVRHNSLEYVIRKIISLKENSSELIQWEVEMIQENCIADIAELQAMEIAVVKASLRK